MQAQPYLFFEGRAEEATEFYRRTVGAEVTTLMRWKDMPDLSDDPGIPADRNKVMHMSFRIGDTTVLASDGGGMGGGKFQGFALALTVANDAEAERVFAALAEGGRVQAPLTKTFFSSRFGILADRFGVNWMIVVAS